MITIELMGVSVELIEARDQNGQRVAVVAYTDPQSGIRVLIPHQPQSAREVAAHLEGRPHIRIVNGIEGGPT